MQSRSGLERFIALAMAGGVVFATSLGTIHDPRCPHHPGGSGHESWYPVALHGPHHADSGAMHAHAHSHEGAPSDQAPDDCTCTGGLCVLSVVAPPPVRTASVVSFWSTEPEGAGFVVFARPALEAERYLQPPGTGPPTVV